MTPTQITISIDVMGGDFGPSVTIPSALNALRKKPNLKCIFVGNAEVIHSILAQSKTNLSAQWEVEHADEVVSMDESPSNALRNKKRSSMRIAINLVKEGRAQACVSAGNTGALMATARFVLKTLPNIDRPALITRFPTLSQKESRVLDLGANVDSTPEQLMQFAVMGAVVAEYMDGNKNPSVGLLNVGKEDIKGNEQVKVTHELLKNYSQINYCGYVEGDAIFRGEIDVIVCDGFVGNATLKACEGMAKLIFHNFKKTLTETFWVKPFLLPLMPVFKKLKLQMDPRTRNGASLVGLNGIVIKSHGNADEIAFGFAISEAILQVEHNIPERISHKIATLLGAHPST